MKECARQTATPLSKTPKGIFDGQEPRTVSPGLFRCLRPLPMGDLPPRAYLCYHWRSLKKAGGLFGGNKICLRIFKL